MIALITKVIPQALVCRSFEPAIAMVARNDPKEQEHVELLEPPAAR
jgi:hypothetical protein